MDSVSNSSNNTSSTSEAVSREHFFAALSRITAAISSSLELGKVLSLLCDEVVKVFDTAAAAIYIFDAPSLQLRLRASVGIDTSGIERLSVEDQTDPVGRAFWIGKPLIVNLDEGHEGGYRMPDAYCRRGFKSLLAMPLIQNERGLGVLVMASVHPQHFGPEDLERAGILAGHAAIAAKNAMLFERERFRSEQLKLAIQEAHHRIKNNLQTVAVLLSLQSSECEEPAAKQALDHSIERVNAISLVHELLSRNSDVRMINTRELLDKLITIVATASTTPSETSSVIRVDTEDVLISSRRATALALIAHELVANALEHGAAGKNGGTIEVSLHKTGNTVAFSVRDNGTGLPDEFDLQRDSGIGLSIVRALAEKDLDGRLEFENCQPGLIVAIYFDDAGVAGDVY